MSGNTRNSIGTDSDTSSFSMHHRFAHLPTHTLVFLSRRLRRQQHSQTATNGRGVVRNSSATKYSEYSPVRLPPSMALSSSTYIPQSDIAKEKTLLSRSQTLDEDSSSPLLNIPSFDYLNTPEVNEYLRQHGPRGLLRTHPHERELLWGWFFAELNHHSLTWRYPLVRALFPGSPAGPPSIVGSGLANLTSTASIQKHNAWLDLQIALTTFMYASVTSIQDFHVPYRCCECLFLPEGVNSPEVCRMDGESSCTSDGELFQCSCRFHGSRLSPRSSSSHTMGSYRRQVSWMLHFGGEGMYEPRLSNDVHVLRCIRKFQDVISDYSGVDTKINSSVFDGTTPDHEKTALPRRSENIRPQQQQPHHAFQPRYSFMKMECSSDSELCVPSGNCFSVTIPAV